MVGKPIDDTAAIARIRALLDEDPGRSRRSVILEVCGETALRRIEAKMKRQDERTAAPESRSETPPAAPACAVAVLPRAMGAEGPHPVEHMMLYLRRPTSWERLSEAYWRRLPWSWLMLVTFAWIGLCVLLQFAPLHHADMQAALMGRAWPGLTPDGVAAVGRIAWWVNWLAFACAVTTFFANDGTCMVSRAICSLAALVPCGAGLSLPQAGLVLLAGRMLGDDHQAGMLAFGTLAPVITPAVVVLGVGYASFPTKAAWILRAGFLLAFVVWSADPVVSVLSGLQVSVAFSAAAVAVVAAGLGVAAARAAGFVFGIDCWEKGCRLASRA